jgi:hypothetical protein
MPDSAALLTGGQPKDNAARRVTYQRRRYANVSFCSAGLAHAHCAAAALDSMQRRVPAAIGPSMRSQQADSEKNIAEAPLQKTDEQRLLSTTDMQVSATGA